MQGLCACYKIEAFIQPLIYVKNSKRLHSIEYLYSYIPLLARRAPINKSLVCAYNQNIIDSSALEHIYIILCSRVYPVYSYNKHYTGICDLDNWILWVVLTNIFVCVSLYSIVFEWSINKLEYTYTEKEKRCFIRTGVQRNPIMRSHAQHSSLQKYHKRTYSR